ncbi:MAG: hypothetical protein KDC92_02570 [Bacteroidetes bacterium]|nr:hypothetical protein [Bacteroidota bacterium]
MSYDWKGIIESLNDPLIQIDCDGRNWKAHLNKNAAIELNLKDKIRDNLHVEIGKYHFSIEDGEKASLSEINVGDKICICLEGYKYGATVLEVGAKAILAKLIPNARHTLFCDKVSGSKSKKSAFTIDFEGSVVSILNHANKELALKQGENLRNLIDRDQANILVAALGQMKYEMDSLEQNLRFKTASGQLKTYGAYFSYLKKQQLIQVELGGQRSSKLSNKSHLEHTISAVSSVLRSKKVDYLSTSSIQNINDIIGADYTFLAKYQTLNHSSRTVYIASANGHVENFEYALADTPCDIVTNNQVCIYRKYVNKVFPKDHLLEEMGIRAYAGVPVSIVDDESGAEYILVSLFKENLNKKKSALVRQVLLVFGEIFSLELSRKKHNADSKKLTAEKEQLLDNLKQYAYYTSHDLRAPLTNLLGLSNKLNIESFQNGSLEKYLEYVRKSCEELDRITRKMNSVLTASEISIR